MIYVLCGPPCAGKSTYIKEHKSESDLVIDYDEIAFCLGGKKYEADGDFRDMAIFLRKNAINRILDGEVKADAWIIDTKPSEAMLEAYKNAGAEIITLDVSKDECLTRAEQDNRPQSTFDGINTYFAEEKGKKMLFKTFESKTDEAGKVAGFFSTYDKVPDSYGDIIEPGAFTKTIEKRMATGHPFPLCLNHDFDKVIGRVDKIEDQETGPYYEASFYKTGLAQDVREWTKDDGPIYQNSFAYDVLKRRDPTDEEKALGIKNVLQEIELYEISIVTVPANQNAVITEVKSVEPETKAGRRNSQKDADIIKQIRDLAQSLLDDKDDDTKPEEDEADEKAAPEVNEASEEQKDNGNSKRASDLLEKIKSIEGGS